MKPETDANNAIARKLASARQGARAEAKSALRALRLAITRASPAEAGLPLAVLGGTQGWCGQDDLADHLPPDDLPLLLDGPDGRIGGMCLGRAVVVAVVRQLTTGTVGEGEPPGRPFTEADAALVAPLVDDIMARAGALAASPADAACLEGYRFGARMASARDLALALEDDRFRVFSLTVQIPGTEWQGGVTLVLPDRVGAEAGADEAGGEDGPGLDRSIGAIRAELSAVMCRLRVPLARLEALRPGDVLPLAPGPFDRAELVAIDGRRIASGQLGQCDGMRAIRLGSTAPHATEGANGAGFAPADPPSGADRAASPAVTGEAEAPPPSPATGPVPDKTDEAEAFERHLRQLSPEEAAAEISRLAGLDTPDTAPDGRVAGGGGE